MMPPCAAVKSKSTCESIFGPPEVHAAFGDKIALRREVAVDMLPYRRRGAGVAGAARRDHDARLL